VGEGYFCFKEQLMQDKQRLMRMIEEMAANAWPAPVQQHLEGWRLRAANGVSRRANSVLAGSAMPGYEHWLDEVTWFYERYGLPARFLVSDASPAELDRLLDGLGYTADAYSSVQVAVCADVLERVEHIEDY
jgi:hypothetical protein